MERFFFLIIVFFFYNSSFAQNENPPKTLENKKLIDFLSKEKNINYLNKSGYYFIDIPKENINMLDGMAIDLKKECNRYEDKIKQDKIDKKIIFELQKNGRLSNFQIADKVGLSPSPCLRRIKNLEKKGVISGYTAIVNEELFGLPIIAFVFVRLENQTDATLKTFEQGINLLSQVVDCWLVTGNRDYLLRVVSQSLKTYEKFKREELTKIKGIASIETNFALGSVKTKQPLPIN